MNYTLKQLQERVNKLIEAQGEDAYCGAWIYTKEDVCIITDEGLQFYNFRCGIIDLNCDDIKVRIVALTCSDCLLSCLSNVTQNVILLKTIRADKLTVKIELSLLH